MFSVKEGMAFQCSAPKENLIVSNLWTGENYLYSLCLINTHLSNHQGGTISSHNANECSSCLDLPNSMCLPHFSDRATRIWKGDLATGHLIPRAHAKHTRSNQQLDYVYNTTRNQFHAVRIMYYCNRRKGFLIKLVFCYHFQLSSDNANWFFFSFKKEKEKSSNSLLFETLPQTGQSLTSLAAPCSMKGCPCFLMAPLLKGAPGDHFSQ